MRLSFLLLFALAACATSIDYPPLPPKERIPKVYTERYPGGADKRRTEYVIDERDRLLQHGSEVRWYESGQLRSEARYANGDLVDTYKSYWSNGNLQSVQEYGDRTSPGAWRWYHETGELSGEGQAIAGRKTGGWTWYHPNGEVARTGDYENGRRVGEWSFFRPDGSPEARGRYVNGRRVIPWTVWDEDGVESQRDYEPADEASGPKPERVERDRRPADDPAS